MKRKSIILLLTIFLLLTSLTGCSDKEVTVCYTIYPIEYILQRVAGNRVNYCKLSTEEPIQVASIVDDYANKIQNATLILQMGQLEPYWEIYANDFKATEATIIDLTGLSAINDFKRYTMGEVNGNKVMVESNYYEGTAFQSIDLYGKDPNLWLDPIAMTSMAKTITEWLMENLPEESAYFAANFKNLEADLVRLDAEYNELMDDKIKIVSILPSFGNWQKAYNIEVYPVILSRYGAMPTDSQLAAIEQRIKDDKITTIVKEENLTEEQLVLYEKVKADCNLKEISLSNLSTLTESEAAVNKDYLTIMYDNLTTLENLSKPAETTTKPKKNK